MPGPHVLREPAEVRVPRDRQCQARVTLVRNNEPVAKTKSAYYCTGCGFESARWLGRCPSCEAWNTFEDAPVVKPAKAAQGRTVAPLRSPGPVPLATIDDAGVARRRTGMAEF